MIDQITTSTITAGDQQILAKLATIEMQLTALEAHMSVLSDAVAALQTAENTLAASAAAVEAAVTQLEAEVAQLQANGVQPADLQGLSDVTTQLSAMADALNASAASATPPTP